MSFMMMVLLAGLGTYLIRLLPMVFGDRLLHNGGRLTLMLSALGLSSIAALIVVSIQDLWQAAPDLANLISLPVGALGVLLTLRLTRNVGVATLGGAAIYGLAIVLLTGLIG